MTVQDTIADYFIRTLRIGGRGSCAPCLSAALALPIAEIEQETTALAEEAFVKRTIGPCTSCDATTLVTRRCISAYAA
jgi:hypothetical protein